MKSRSLEEARALVQEVVLKMDRTEPTEYDPVRCFECGKELGEVGHPSDLGYTHDDDVWFSAEESPTGNDICGECFDKLPCDGCRGL